MVPFQPLFLNNIKAHISKYFCQTGLIKTEYKSQTTMNVLGKNSHFHPKTIIPIHTVTDSGSIKQRQSAYKWIKTIHFVWKSKMSLFKSKTIQTVQIFDWQALHYWLRRPMGFKRCEHFSKVEVWFLLILTLTTKKIVPLESQVTQILWQFFWAHFHN